MEKKTFSRLRKSLSFWFEEKGIRSRSLLTFSKILFVKFLDSEDFSNSFLFFLAFFPRRSWSRYAVVGHTYRLYSESCCIEMNHLCALWQHSAFCISLLLVGSTKNWKQKCFVHAILIKLMFFTLSNWIQCFFLDDTSSQNCTVRNWIWIENGIRENRERNFIQNVSINFSRIRWE